MESNGLFDGGHASNRWEGRIAGERVGRPQLGRSLPWKPQWVAGHGVGSIHQTRSMGVKAAGNVESADRYGKCR